MKLSIAAIAAASFAGHVAAQGCAAKAINNAGNPIRRPLNEIVTAGTPFTITWDNTTAGPVSLELLRGPSENVVPIACIAGGIVNNGEFPYTFPTSLTPDTSRYGLRIIDDKTGDFQYSTQFGIRNDVVHPVSSKYPATTTSAAKEDDDKTSTAKPQTSSMEAITTSGAADTTSPFVPIVTAPANSSSSVIIATTHIPIPIPSSGGVTSYSIIQPSGNMTVPASLRSKTTQVIGVTASASASFSTASGTGSPIVSQPAGSTSAPDSGAGQVMAGGLLAGLGAMAALFL
ncbi:MAG: hypothetical protein Q9174_005186 [Haloplaca sp. 1 TL-2023]